MVQDHQVALLHQGKTNLALPIGVQEIFGNRKELESVRHEIRNFAPDIVLDIILSSRQQALDLINVCKGIAKGSSLLAVATCIKPMMCS